MMQSQVKQFVKIVNKPENNYNMEVALRIINNKKQKNKTTCRRQISNYMKLIYMHINTYMFICSRIYMYIYIY